MDLTGMRVRFDIEAPMGAEDIFEIKGWNILGEEGVIEASEQLESGDYIYRIVGDSDIFKHELSPWGFWFDETHFTLL